MTFDSIVIPSHLAEVAINCHCLRRRHSFSTAIVHCHQSMNTPREYSTITETLERKISTVQVPIPKDPERSPSQGSQILLETLQEAEKAVYDLMEGVIAERLGVVDIDSTSLGRQEDSE